MASQHLENILKREMTRKEFMVVATLAVGSIFGMSSIIKLLTGKSLASSSSINDPLHRNYGK
jgi:3-dehydroquinate dehydratase